MSVWTWSEHRRRRFLGAWAIALSAGAMAVLLAAHSWRALPRPHPLEELSYYPSGEFLRPMTLGHAETAADLAWLRAVQYYGAHRLADNRFDRLPHVFDILTTLAPRFVSAYGFGAFAMGQEGRTFERGESLLLKGIAANPRSGRLAFELGFLYYVRPGGRDLQRAAEMFEQAARQPDAPPQAGRFAAYARQHAGDLRLAWELWAGVARNSPNKYLQELAEKNMRRIEEAIASGRRQDAVHRLTTPQILLLENPEPPAPKAAQVPARQVR